MSKLSIVVPVYNVENYVGKLIESLLKQTWKDLEIILVDDGSPDKSGAICDQYAAKDSRIQVIHKKNGGVGAARNDGLKIASGEWIIFCDSDDWLELDALEQLVKAAERSGADIAFGDANLAYGEDNIHTNQLYRQSFVAEGREQIDRLIAAVMSRNYCSDPPEAGPGNGGYGGPWNKLIKRQLIVENQIHFDVRVKGNFDDILFIAYAYAAAKKIAYINVPVYNYRQLETSIAHSTAFKSNILEINAAIFEAWNEFMARYGEDGRYLKPYYANVIRRLKSTLGTYFFNSNNPKSLRKQLSEFKALLHTSPYADAIRNAEADKLHNSYDKMIWKAARRNSPLGVYCIYELSFLAKKLRNVFRKFKIR